MSARELWDRQARAARRRTDEGTEPVPPRRSRVVDELPGFTWECDCGQRAGSWFTTRGEAQFALDGHRTTGLMHRDVGWRDR